MRAPSGERFTVYTAKAQAETTQMRYAAQGNESAMFWADRGVGYVVSAAAATADADPDRASGLRPDGEERRVKDRPIAFSSESLPRTRCGVDTGSREEIASKRKLELPF